MTDAEKGKVEGYFDDDAVTEKFVSGEGDKNAIVDEGLLSPAVKALSLTVIKYAFYLLIVAYLLAAFILDFKRATPLFILLVLVVAYSLWTFVSNKNEGSFSSAEDGVVNYLEKSDTELKYGLITSSVPIAIMVIIMAIYVRSARNLISLFGLLVFLGLSWLFSWKPKKVKLRPVLFGTFIQFIFGFIVIRTTWGLSAMTWLGEFFVQLLNYTYAGSSFTFGFLADGSLFGDTFVQGSGNEYVLAPPLFFNVLPTVIFFAALTSIGYYLRIVPWIVQKIGYFLGLLLGTSASESLSMAGNIFVGQTEAPLLVKPLMKDMTNSELHAIMTGGFATIAGGVFFVYISFGIPAPAILAASIMSAPAALAVSKITYPETEDSPTSTGKKGVYEVPPSDDCNALHAAANGAVVGTQLMLNIAGNLIAFLALLQMLNAILGWLGAMIDIPTLSFETICEVIFWPVAWLMGIDAADCPEVARLLGLKVFANEFVAYEVLAFSGMKDQISERSFYIVSYALCGFSNVGSIGIQLGGLTPLAPTKARNLAQLVTSAMIAGNTACIMTACIAGIFYEP